MTDLDPTAKLPPMNPCASAGKKPVTEEILHSLGWTFHAESQTWNFHGIKRPCLSRKSALLEEILWQMHASLSKSMGNIENNMRALGVTVPELVKEPKPTPNFSGGEFSMPPGAKGPRIGAPEELHKFLDAIVDTARKQGARIQITLDPNRGQMFDPLRIVEQMLGDRCPHCRGEHGHY